MPGDGVCVGALSDDAEDVGVSFSVLSEYKLGNTFSKLPSSTFPRVGLSIDLKKFQLLNQLNGFHQVTAAVCGESKTDVSHHTAIVTCGIIKDNNINMNIALDVFFITIFMILHVYIKNSTKQNKTLHKQGFV